MRPIRRSINSCAEGASTSWKDIKKIVGRKSYQNMLFQGFFESSYHIEALWRIFWKSYQIFEFQAYFERVTRIGIFKIFQNSFWQSFRIDSSQEYFDEAIRKLTFQELAELSGHLLSQEYLSCQIIFSGRRYHIVYLLRIFWKGYQIMEFPRILRMSYQILNVSRIFSTIFWRSYDIV